MATKSVLIVGGSGYLGQFLVANFASEDWKVGYTHHSTSAPSFQALSVKEYWANLATGEGLDECIKSLQPLDVVINCAAVSQPAVCERDMSYAQQVNIPTSLLTALVKNREATGNEPLLIHISTDQVYDGTKSMWKEEGPCEPVNCYGNTKLQGEHAIQAQWSRHFILRSSIIFGPRPPGAPVGRALFLQFVNDALASGKPTTFFTDEWRCPIYVDDIIKVCHTLINNEASVTSSSSSRRVFNMGGPERLSRLDMAKAVAAVKGYDEALIVPASAASIERGVQSPADISMDSSRLWAATGITPLSFATALIHVFQKDTE